MTTKLMENQGSVIQKVTGPAVLPVVGVVALFTTVTATAAQIIEKLWLADQ